VEICFPVGKDEGMESSVYDHFGSAPLFILVDTTSGALTSIDNRDRHHEHGACNPARALENHHVDAVVIGGIGPGALNRLKAMGINVYRSGAVSVRENLDLFVSGQLDSVNLQRTCVSRHGPGSGCAH